MTEQDPGEQPALDVFVSGLLFLDVAFADLDAAPTLGAEVWTKQLATGPGGIANFARILPPDPDPVGQ